MINLNRYNLKIEALRLVTLPRVHWNATLLVSPKVRRANDMSPVFYGVVLYIAAIVYVSAGRLLTEIQDCPLIQV
jgi:hypothetical protein